MNKIMSRQQRRNIERIAAKKGSESKEVLNAVVEAVKGKIIKAVKEVDIVALNYVLVEHLKYSPEEAKEVIIKFSTTIDEFNEGVLSYETIKSRLEEN